MVTEGQNHNSHLAHSSFSGDHLTIITWENIKDYKKYLLVVLPKTFLLGLFYLGFNRRKML